MSAAGERVTPSTSADKVPTESYNNHLLPPESCHTHQQPNKKTALPHHRHKCVKCGCPRFCCTQVGFLLWVLFLILVQAGPISVLYMDHLFSDKYGSTLSRYQTEAGMQAVLCRTVGIYSVNITGKCKESLVNQPCLKVRVAVYPSHKVNTIINSTFLILSEREYVLQNIGPDCFKLDICDIDNTDSWTEYKRKIRDYRYLLAAKQKRKQSFICYYKMHEKNYKEYPLVLLEMNTSLWDFFSWFILPVVFMCICWLCIVFLCYWFCYPCDKEETGPREYHEINALDIDRSDYSINSPAAGSGAAVGFSASPGADGGGWPTKGPSDNDTSTWPLYWR